MPHPYHSSWLDHPNNIWWRIQIVKFFITQSYASPVTSSPLRPKYFSEHSILYNPKLRLMPRFEIPSYTAIPTISKIIFRYILIFIFLYSKGEVKGFCIEQFPDISLLLIYSRMQLDILGLFPYIWNLPHCQRISNMLNNIFPIFKLWYCPVLFFIIRYRGGGGRNLATVRKTEFFFTLKLQEKSWLIVA